MIFWRGKGWLVPVLFIFAAVLPELMSQELHIEWFSNSTNRLIVCGLLMLPFSYLIWVIGKKLNNKSQNEKSFHWKDIFEEGFGEQISHISRSPSHSFCFIKIQYWSFVYIIGYILFIVFDFI